MLRSGEENRHRQIFFAIGGMAFKGFDFLSEKKAAQKAGANACAVAKEYHVGIEIDHESKKGDDVEGLKAFVKGFRRGCPMGKYLLSMDIMGGPGGGGIKWGPAAVKALVPPGSPTDEPPEGDWLDFVNVMVIDACSTGKCLTGFWKQWNDPEYFKTKPDLNPSLNFKRATFAFPAGGTFGICNQADSEMIREAWAWAKEQGAYGLRAWGITPGQGGDWNPECDEDAPGFKAMCAAVGTCDAPVAAKQPATTGVGDAAAAQIATPVTPLTPAAPVTPVTPPIPVVPPSAGAQPAASDGLKNELAERDRVIAERDAATAARNAEIMARSNGAAMPPAAVATSVGRCWSIRNDASDKWCEANCAAGDCPSNACECDSSATALAKEASPAAPGHCQSISATTTDDWCTATCAAGDCPANTCKCEAQASAPAQVLQPSSL